MSDEQKTPIVPEGVESCPIPPCVPQDRPIPENGLIPPVPVDVNEVSGGVDEEKGETTTTPDMMPKPPFEGKKRHGKHPWAPGPKGPKHGGCKGDKCHHHCEKPSE